jgi:subtilase family serine protease
VAPADGPYGTAIGGISLALNADDSIAFETAYEDNISWVLNQGTIYDPSARPYGDAGFLGGSAGGTSAYFARPSFQARAVAGTQRGVPDFSWVSDPYTGLIMVASTPTGDPRQSWSAYGGNDVATAMFSGLWAIANQRAGVALGQAAPYLYSLPATAVTDIVPYSSTNDATATVQETSSSSTKFDAVQTFGVQPGFGSFYSALWENPQGLENTTVVLAFGTSNQFKAASGWDVVTGVGAPRDAKAFVDWVAGDNQ